MDSAENRPSFPLERIDRLQQLKKLKREFADRAEKKRSALWDESQAPITRLQGTLQVSDTGKLRMALQRMLTKMLKLVKSLR
jgi:hypothetical protein